MPPPIASEIPIAVRIPPPIAIPVPIVSWPLLKGQTSKSLRLSHTAEKNTERDHAAAERAHRDACDHGAAARAHEAVVALALRVVDVAVVVLSTRQRLATRSVRCSHAAIVTERAASVFRAFLRALVEFPRVVLVFVCRGYIRRCEQHSGKSQRPESHDETTEQDTCL